MCNGLRDLAHTFAIPATLTATIASTTPDNLKNCQAMAKKFDKMKMKGYHLTIILGAIDIDMSSWKRSLHAYGSRTCDM